MYTIKQASQLIGIPTVTLRAWEQRYNAVTPIRTESGYRLYTEDQIEDLRWLKSKTDEEGLYISQAVLLLQQRKQAVLEGVEEQESRTSTEAQSKAVAVPTLPHAWRASSLPLSSQTDDEIEQDGNLVDMLYATLSRYQSEQARMMMDMGFAMYGYDRMIGDVFIPLLIKVGDEWHAGRATVAQEHFMTQFIIQRCYSFFQILPLDHQLPKVLAFCPSGEHHHVGLLLFSLFLRQKGAEVIYLGPDTPEDGIEQIVREQQITLICISLNDPNRLPSVLPMIDHLRNKFEEITFALGGNGFVNVGEPYRNYCAPGKDSNSWELWFEEIYLQLKPVHRS
ncbi:MerR family transcriptional regulator [Paenibacillus assamensis]|uniref:MerR family transcriptional regulator n=1 Tax=Paenibacillus assamensis TaxID=311244 RepID=UPI0004088A11|nr:MerR family transcriptional regulator [Paenibacillus assamensis]